MIYMTKPRTSMVVQFLSQEPLTKIDSILSIKKSN